MASALLCCVDSKLSFHAGEAIRGIAACSRFLKIPWRISYAESPDQIAIESRAAYARKQHSLGIYTTANVHDADGVRPSEDQHFNMARAIGIAVHLSCDYC